MEIITQLMDFVIHIDRHLAEIIQNYGTWAYLILFIIIFSETGLVVTPFLPGDSMLFVVGALCTTGALNINLAILLLIIAAVVGNTLNYFIGKMIGERIMESRKNRFVKKEYIGKAQAFYDKYGGKAIFLSRFLPILRTFAPFVAGIGKMSFDKFSMYNIAGAAAWVLVFMLGGFFFGNIPIVKENLTYVIFGIIFVSLLPAVITGLKVKKEEMKVIIPEE
ncbi:MAG TPA: DedA family protein [Desulfitobacteriaceae bacterium]|nr:DedA family protein [Desulfitobacteriaceae bacterium]